MTAPQSDPPTPLAVVVCCVAFAVLVFMLAPNIRDAAAACRKYLRNYLRRRRRARWLEVQNRCKAERFLHAARPCLDSTTCAECIADGIVFAPPPRHARVIVVRTRASPTRDVVPLAG